VVAEATGVLLDAMIRSAPAPRDAGARSRLDTAIYAAGIAAGTGTAVYGAARILIVLRMALPRPAFLTSIGVAALTAGLGVAGVVATVLLAGRGAPAGDALAVSAEDTATLPGEDGDGIFRARFDRVIFGAVGVAGALLVLAVGRDMSEVFEGMPNQIRIWHLVTYNYRRPWPTSLDFTPALAAFTIAAAVIFLALAFARARRHVVSVIVAFGLAFGVWGVGEYVTKVSPHWGQRETTIAYYEAAREVPGPLIAYQMNWKGENLYTGNHVPAFVSSGKKFQDYIQDEKKKGIKTFYFVTEHGRTGTLSNELGTTKAFEKLTPPELNNKFGLVRARFE
jgi:hypothetical protein